MPASGLQLSNLTINRIFEWNNWHLSTLQLVGSILVCQAMDVYYPAYKKWFGVECFYELVEITLDVSH
jgi:hypothetical protein